MANNSTGKQPCGGCAEEVKRLQAALDHRDRSNRDYASALNAMAEKYAEMKAQLLTLAREYDKLTLNNGIPQEDHEVSGPDVSEADGEGSPDVEHEHSGKLVQPVRSSDFGLQRWEIGNQRHLPASKPGNPGGPVQRRSKR